jgi:hypothetical protein
MKIYQTALFFMIYSASWSSPISIGDTKLEIPNPPGFGPITPQMKELYQLQQQYIESGHDQLFAYIEESEIPKALNNEMLNINKYFSIQTPTIGKRFILSIDDFAKIKNNTKIQNEGIFKKAGKEIPALIDRDYKEAIKQFNIKPALSIPDTIPLPPHKESNGLLAYSTITRIRFIDNAGSPKYFVSVVTTTHLYIRGKLLILYLYSDENGIEYGRGISEQWADSVVAANSSDSSLSANTLSSFENGIDWGKVPMKGIIGAMIGLIIGIRHAYPG